MVDKHFHEVIIAFCISVCKLKKNRSGLCQIQVKMCMESWWKIYIQHEIRGTKFSEFPLSLLKAQIQWIMAMCILCIRWTDKTPFSEGPVLDKTTHILTTLVFTFHKRSYYLPSPHEKRKLKMVHYLPKGTQIWGSGRKIQVPSL